MYRFSTSMVLLALVGLAGSGCDADCDNPNRIDGSYAVWSTLEEQTKLSGDNLDAYPLEEMFVNGWSEWDLKYVPSQQAFHVTIREQLFTADYVQDDTSCNGFGLVFSGTYTAPEDTVHEFNWDGELRYFGSHLGGTFSYEDDWTDPDSGDSGTIVIGGGQITANARDNDDTGF